MSLSLAETQLWFLGEITNPVRVDAEVEITCAVARSAETHDVDELVRRPPTESARERLSIYHRSYFSRLEECLADDYSALSYALGKDAFSALCREYVTSRPSRSPNLNGFGRGMSEFLRQHRPEWVFEAELSELEWALIHAVHAPAPESHLATELSAVAPQALATLRFVPSPAARLIATLYPVNGFFQAFIKEQSPSKPNPEEAWVVVVRHGYKIWRLDLSRDEATVLERLFDARPLSEALDGVHAQASDVQAWFKRWASAGIFRGVRMR
jgi:hypothetical protein